MDKYYKIDKLTIRYPLCETSLSIGDSIFFDTENNMILNDPKIYLLCKNVRHINIALDCDSIKFDYKDKEND